MSTSAAAVDRAGIVATERTIRPYIRRTPVLSDGAVTLKLEGLQHTGSFKTRGAFANLLLRDVPAAGVVAASGGNHGAAVAYAAMTLGVPAAIFVPSVSSPAKVALIRRFGAEIVIGGAGYSDAYEASLAHVARTGALAVHAFDAPETILGQATLGMELEESTPDLDTILVGVGGGGLIAGIASWYDGRAKIVGAEPEGAPTLHVALSAGAPVDAPVGSVAIDSLAPRRVGELTFAIARALVAGVVLVSDDEIRAAQSALWERYRIVAEPGAAAAYGALLAGRYAAARGERIGVVVSGANAALAGP